MEETGKNKPYRTLIIGLGRIGLLYDYEKPKESYVLTHARAFSRNTSFQLVGGIDPLKENRSKFSSQYSCPAFSDIRSGMEATQPDIVVIATPTGEHPDTLREILRHNPLKAVLCEKPLAGSLAESRVMLEECADKGTQIYVNYMRQADVTVNELKTRLENGTISSPVRGTVWYSRGMYNSASHFVNLLQHLFGEAQGVTLLNRGKNPQAPDPEPDFRVSFTGGDFSFLAVQSESLFHNSMEWIARTGRLRYEKGGAYTSWEPASEDTVFSGYTTVTGTGKEELPGDFYRMQQYVAEQLALGLQGKSDRICTGEQALQTIEIINRVQELL